MCSHPIKTDGAFHPRPFRQKTDVVILYALCPKSKKVALAAVSRRCAAPRIGDVATAYGYPWQGHPARQIHCLGIRQGLATAGRGTDIPGDGEGETQGPPIFLLYENFAFFLFLYYQTKHRQGCRVYPGRDGADMAGYPSFFSWIVRGKRSQRICEACTRDRARRSVARLGVRG